MDALLARLRRSGPPLNHFNGFRLSEGAFYSSIGTNGTIGTDEIPLNLLVCV